MRQVIEGWALDADPDADRRNAMHLYAHRNLMVAARPNGAVDVLGQLDPVGGAAVITALDAVATSLRSPKDDRTAGPAARRRPGRAGDRCAGLRRARPGRPHPRQRRAAPPGRGDHPAQRRPRTPRRGRAGTDRPDQRRHRTTDHVRRRGPARPDRRHHRGAPRPRPQPPRPRPAATPSRPPARRRLPVRRLRPPLGLVRDPPPTALVPRRPHRPGQPRRPEAVARILQRWPGGGVWAGRVAGPLVRRGLLGGA